VAPASQRAAAPALLAAQRFSSPRQQHRGRHGAVSPSPGDAHAAAAASAAVGRSHVPRYFFPGSDAAAAPNTADAVGSGITPRPHVALAGAGAAAGAGSTSSPNGVPFLAFHASDGAVEVTPAHLAGGLSSRGLAGGPGSGSASCRGAKPRPWVPAGPAVALQTPGGTPLVSARSPPPAGVRLLQAYGSERELLASPSVAAARSLSSSGAAQRSPAGVSPGTAPASAAASAAAGSASRAGRGVMLQTPPERGSSGRGASRSRSRRGGPGAASGGATRTSPRRRLEAASPAGAAAVHQPASAVGGNAPGGRASLEFGSAITALLSSVQAGRATDAAQQDGLSVPAPTNPPRPAHSPLKRLSQSGQRAAPETASQSPGVAATVQAAAVQQHSEDSGVHPMTASSTAPVTASLAAEDVANDSRPAEARPSSDASLAAAAAAAAEMVATAEVAVSAVAAPYVPPAPKTPPHPPLLNDMALAGVLDLSVAAHLRALSGAAGPLSARGLPSARQPATTASGQTPRAPASSQEMAEGAAGMPVLQAAGAFADEQQSADLAPVPASTVGPKSVSVHVPSASRRSVVQAALMSPTGLVPSPTESVRGGPTSPAAQLPLSSPAVTRDHAAVSSPGRRHTIAGLPASAAAAPAPAHPLGGAESAALPAAASAQGGGGVPGLRQDKGLHSVPSAQSVFSQRSHASMASAAGTVVYHADTDHDETDGASTTADGSPTSLAGSHQQQQASPSMRAAAARHSLHGTGAIASALGGGHPRAATSPLARHAQAALEGAHLLNGHVMSGSAAPASPAAALGRDRAATADSAASPQADSLAMRETLELASDRSASSAGQHAMPDAGNGAGVQEPATAPQRRSFSWSRVE